MPQNEIFKDINDSIINLDNEKAIELGNIPISAKSNAGQPRIEGLQTFYDQPIEEFVRDIQEMIKIGVKVVGGCRGTSPKTINEIRKIIDKI